MAKSLEDRAVLDHEARDPHNQNLRNYYVLTEGLQGHEDGCTRDSIQAVSVEPAEVEAPAHVRERAINTRICERAINELLRITSADTPAPEISAQPQLQLAAVADEPPTLFEAKTERELFYGYVRKYAYDTQSSYQDCFSRVYVLLAFEGKECRHRSSRGKSIAKIEYCEAKGWCGRALEIARREFPLPAPAWPSDMH